jgi:hypothetical protein
MQGTATAEEIGSLSAHAAEEQVRREREGHLTEFRMLVSVATS